MKEQVYDLLEPGRGDRLGKAVDAVSLMLVLATIASIVLLSLDGAIAVWAASFLAAGLVLFTVEYLLRLWSCTAHMPRHEYAFSPLGLIDFFAVVPFYLLILASIATGGRTPTILAQLVAVLLIFKVARYSHGLQTLGRVVLSRQRELFAILIVELTVLLLASSAMYFIEGEAQPEQFGTIPRAMWWAVVTLSTVGYGDTAPITDMGKLVAGFVAMFGVAMFALPAGVLGAAFSEELKKK